MLNKIKEHMKWYCIARKVKFKMWWYHKATMILSGDELIAKSQELRKQCHEYFDSCPIETYQNIFKDGIGFALVLMVVGMKKSGMYYESNILEREIQRISEENEKDN